MLLTYNGSRPGTLLNILQCIGQPHNRECPETLVHMYMEGQEDGGHDFYLVKSLEMKLGNQGHNSSSGKKCLVAKRSHRNGGPESVEHRGEGRTVCRKKAPAT